MSTTRYVFAKGTGVTTVDGVRVNLTVGEAWDATDPVVGARPDLFSDQPQFVRRTAGGLVVTQRAEVEQATAAPGEKRSTRRPAKKTASEPQASE
jgi:hypothetical protein